MKQLTGLSWFSELWLLWHAYTISGEDLGAPEYKGTLFPSLKFAVFDFVHYRHCRIVYWCQLTVTLEGRCPRCPPSCQSCRLLNSLLSAVHKSLVSIQFCPDSCAVIFIFIRLYLFPAFLLSTFLSPKSLLQVFFGRPLLLWLSSVHCCSTCGQCCLNISFLVNKCVQANSIFFFAFSPRHPVTPRRKLSGCVLAATYVNSASHLSSSTLRGRW